MNEKGIKGPNFIKNYYVNKIKVGTININTEIANIQNETKTIFSF